MNAEEQQEPTVKELLQLVQYLDMRLIQAERDIEDLRRVTDGQKRIGPTPLDEIRRALTPRCMICFGEHFGMNCPYSTVTCSESNPQ